MIESLLSDSNFYFKKFNKILILSPSKFLSIKLTEDNSRPNLDLEWLFSKFEEYNKMRETMKIKVHINILVIIDDLIADLKKNESDIRLN